MRDGVELCANLWMPAARGRFPLALYRTPYRKSDRLTHGLRQFRDAGYAVIVQDVRGRGHSEGIFRQLFQEENDTEDTLEWAIRQSWSDGTAGLFGGSYPGIAAWRGALSRHPALKAIAPSFSGGDEYMDRYYSAGGGFRLGHRLWWISENFSPPGRKRLPFADLVQHLPLRTGDIAGAGMELDFFQAALDHPAYDAYWRSLSTLQAISRTSVPPHITSGWFDPYCGSDLEMYAALRAVGRPAQLLLGPWGHNPSVPAEGVDQAQMRNAFRRFELEWFDAWIRGKRPEPPSRVRYFVMGANVWKESPSWPPGGTIPEELFLHSQGRANRTNGGGTLEPEAARISPPDTYVYDPANPVPTIGGATCCNPRLWMWGPLDQRPLARRDDILSYAGPRLREPLEIAGPVRLFLTVRSTASDTDFMAKLVDVSPEGTERLVCDGMLRLRYRHGLERPASYQPGAVERITVWLGDIAWRFAPGHRVRLDITSSNFPRFDRNLNSSRPLADEKTLRKATQTVLHDRRNPSHLVLPVVRSGIPPAMSR